MEGYDQAGLSGQSGCGIGLYTEIYGHWAAILLTAMILFTAFASVFALMLGYSRIPYAAALDGLFFSWFGKLHPKGEFPNRSLVLVGILAAVASMFSLGDIITGLMVARILVEFVGHTIGLFVLRKTQPEVKLPFRMWLYPLPAILALLGWLSIFGSSAFQPGGWKFMAYAFTTICVGIGGYLFSPTKAYVAHGPSASSEGRRLALHGSRTFRLSHYMPTPANCHPGSSFSRTRL